MNQTLKICVSVQTAGTVDVPGTSTSFVPPSSAASWFCPVAAADRTDTLPVAPPARAKDRLRIRHPLSLRSIKRSVSALMDVPESLRMYSDEEVTAGRHCLLMLSVLGYYTECTTRIGGRCPVYFKVFFMWKWGIKSDILLGFLTLKNHPSI